MKKITFLFALFVSFCWQANAQLLNQAASWPNTNWVLNGTYDSGSLLNDPTTTTNLSYDDDNAGSGSTDILQAESPVIDLTTAHTGGETYLHVVYNYDYNLGDVFNIEYYDADATSWVVWEAVSNNSASTSGYCSNLPTTSDTTVELDVSGFTATQLSGFQYRFHYDASTVYGWGFCLASPTIYSATPPSCPDPTTLSAGTITSNSAILSWTEVGTASAWEIEWDTAGFSVGSGNSVQTTTNPHSLGSLSGNTDYEFYVRAACAANDSSAWVGPFSFTTLCSTFTPNYTETFDSFVPSCWDEAADGDLTTGPTSLGSGLWGSKSALGSTVGINLYTDNRSEWILSPYFDLSVGGYEVSIDVAVTNWNSSVADAMGSDDSVRLVYSEDGLTWNVLRTWTVADNLANSLTPFVISVPSTGTNVQFGILATDGPVDDSEDYDFHVDNFIVRTPPACAAPSALTVSNVIANTADLGWTENGTATSWDIEWDTAGFTPTGTPTVSATSTNPHTLSGLTELTNYEYYVRANCGSSTSTWVGPFAFFTPISQLNCTGAFASMLFTEDFEGAFPSGWNQVATSDPDWTWDGSGGTSSSGTGPSAAYSGSGFLYLETSSGSQNEEDTLTSPSIDLSLATTTARLTFQYHMFGGDIGTLNVEISDDAGATWNSGVSFTGEQQTSNADAWKTAAVDLTSYMGSSIMIRFIGSKGGTSYEGDIAIDLVQIESCATCPAPSVLTVNNITNNSADLGWTENGAATAWDIEWDTVGFTLGNGNLVTGTSTNPHTISGMTGNTSYEFYVRSSCSATDSSSWVGPYSFTTLCDVYLAPFLEEFATNSLPQCWSESGDNSWEYGSTATTPSGPAAYGAANVNDYSAGGNGTFIVMDGSDNGNGEISSVVTPMIDISGLTNPYFSYAVFSNNTNDTAQNKLIVELFDGTNWLLMDSIQTNLGTNWVVMDSNLTSLAITNNVQVRFTVTGDNSNGGQTYHNDILIDNIQISEMPLIASAIVDSNSTCAGVADGGATASGMMGTTPYSYLWSNGATTASITGVLGGNFTVTVTDANGGTDTAMVTITTGTQAPVVSLGNDTSICDGVTLTLDAGMHTTYTWDDASTMQTKSVSYVLGAATYGVTVTDVDGCQGSDDIVVTGFASPLVDLGNDTTVCDGETITLDAGAFTSYLWDDASTVQTRMTVSTIGAVNYSVEVTDANGCMAADTIEVTGSAPVMVDLGSDTALCNGAPYTLDAGAGFTSYFWNNGFSTQTLDVSSTSAGTTTYSVRVEDAAGCSGRDTAIISVKAPVLVDLGRDTNIWANGVDTHTLDAGAGFTSYLWSDNVTTTQTYEVRRATEGLVSVIVEDADGCEGTDTVKVTFAPVGVEEFTASTLTMYPNPAVDQVSVELSNLDNVSNVNVTFLSITGQVVLAKNIMVKGANSVETFDVSSLATGTYLVQFEANGNVVTKQFVIK